jgi:LysM repeat protein
MKLRLVYLTILCLLLPVCGNITTAQEYKQVPVTISKDKVKNNGKLYYSHVVLERQTLYSISKAYGVTLQEIYDANPNLKLETEGLKQYQILLIPVASQTAQTAENAQPVVAEPANQAANPEETVSKEEESQEEEFIIHKVKWYEELSDIAAKYGVSTKAIMNYNNLTSTEVNRKMRLRIPQGNTLRRLENQSGEIVNEEVSGSDETAVQDSKSAEDSVEDTSFSLFGGKRQVHTALILPFETNGQSSDNMYDFYCGALLAVKDLETEGITTHLNVYDFSRGGLDESSLSAKDVIIGPVSATDISSVLSLCPSGKYLVSPLEPKAAALAESQNGLVQAPSSSESQCRELITWLGEDLRSTDKVLLFCEKGATLTANATLLKQDLENSGIAYETISYAILEGRSIIDRIERVATLQGTNRIVVASESEAFVNDVIRNVNLMLHRKLETVIYCLSKVRNFDTIEVSNFHNARMHSCSSYYIDYDNEKVKAFLSAYRALYGAEPGPFAYQGYDSTYLTVKSYSLYGRNWTEKIEGKLSHGLQSDFKFERLESGSLVNKAVRRIIYDDGYAIRLVK